MRSFNLLFLLIFSLAQTSYVLAQDDNVEQKDEIKVEFPVITQKIDKSLFEGDVEKIKQAIEAKKKHINLLTENLKQQQKALTIQITNLSKQLEKDEKGEIVDNINNQDLNEQIEQLKAQTEAIASAIDGFKDIHYKFVNLLHELDGSDDKDNANSNDVKELKLEKPYTIFSVIKLNEDLQNLLNQKEVEQQQIKQSTNRLLKLEDLLSDIVVEYTMELSKTDKNNSRYTILRNIYLYQTDYATLKLKNSKQQKRLKTIEEKIKTSNKLLPKVISDMQVT
ncbi:MAG TPA: hypothetical protein ENJ44_03050, partial [Oceanospirillales bacterium]|nr:hypothetical protein [Oceanospirillales bacterium]